LDFFQKYNHKLIPSSPVIPFDDPTILFTNAGMNQFKDIFTGKQKVDYKRATSSQKCIRAGGKHNDLDNVGFTARHHTFFEMLGNFSFGDYFKEEAIVYAWEWVTKELGMPVEKLYATVYDTDDEAFAIWEKVAPELKNGRILRFGKKDNYWSMGDIGPCGPCSEIHFDRGEKFGTGKNDIINGETDRFVEIWNLVFMQYDQLADGKQIDLPNPSVDTGAGLERFAAILQGTESNYEIDLFANLIKATEEVSKKKYKGDLISSFHVVVDHLRALTFAISDGAGISNEGQGYVLRRILRRAARHGRLMDIHEPFIYKLVPALVSEMGDEYPEIKEKQSHIENVIKAEEESFGRTLETGLELFENIVTKLKGDTIPGEEVFRLYDTYGFPYDLTELMAVEKGLKLDKENFDKAMSQRQQQSREGAIFNSMAEDAAKSLVKGFSFTDNESEFDRSGLRIETELLFANAGETDDAAIVLSKTPFYVEAGGQISDTGRIYSEKFEFTVTAMVDFQGHSIHLGKFTKGNSGDANKAKTVTAEVDSNRRLAIMRNHTVTHLTHAALRKVLGDHIKQSGSYVGPDRMRFDFSHHQPMTDVEIEQVEQIVNNEILKNNPVVTDEMSIKDAKKSGATALFGEKYEDNVRVVSVDDFSKELCGGTHVDNVSQIGPFFITMETGIASGVRRIEAITGDEAIKYMLDAKSYRRNVSNIVGRPETDSLAGVEQLKEQYSLLQKELKKVKAGMFSNKGNSVGEETNINGLTFVSNDFGETDSDIMASWPASNNEQAKPLVPFAFGIVDSKPTLMASASSSAVKEYKMHAGNIIKEVLKQFDGRGGGKPNFAQGSIGRDVAYDKLIDSTKKIIFKMLK
jgi:alanyl-tRNA synthetase